MKFRSDRTKTYRAIRVGQAAPSRPSWQALHYGQLRGADPSDDPAERGVSAGDDRPELTMQRGGRPELIHCASLVHDDLPCFDDADTRGKVICAPCLQRAFAVLDCDSPHCTLYACAGRHRMQTAQLV
jgi:geranylgeranyl diphosphate synthase type II